MKIGISLACFYPMHPEDCIKRATELGFDTAELFLNTFSELDDSYIELFAERCEKHNLKIHSIHPFTSALENYMFFSPYDRRIADSKVFYSKYCRIANRLGAKVINMHGDRGIGLKDIDKYICCLNPLLELSAQYNVTIAQENVFYNSINVPDFVYALRSKLGNGAVGFTFDIKQAHKGGSDPYELCQAMGSDIVNFHINDYDDTHLCMLPCSGKTDYNKLFSILKENKYDGPALIEVYSDNYKNDTEILKAVSELKKFSV